jgi:uncharacterized protein YukE
MGKEKLNHVNAKNALS